MLAFLLIRVQCDSGTELIPPSKEFTFSVLGVWLGGWDGLASAFLP